MPSPLHPDIKCANCAFFQPASASPGGHCRCHRTKTDNRLYPLVEEDDYCGNFYHKDRYLEDNKKYLTPLP